MTILILHGIQGKAGDHWEQWLHDQLVAQGYPVIMPTLPESQHPERFAWLRAAKQYIQDVDPESLIIVGHSLGVATALDVIETNEKKVRALISVSGFSYDYGSDLNNYFMDKKIIDFVEVKNHLEQSFVLYGDNDPYVPQNVLHDLAEELEVTPTVLPKGGHLNTAAGYTTFPQVLKIIESIT